MYNIQINDALFPQQDVSHSLTSYSQSNSTHLAQNVFLHLTQLVIGHLTLSRTGGKERARTLALPLYKQANSR